MQSVAKLFHDIQMNGRYVICLILFKIIPNCRSDSSSNSTSDDDRTAKKFTNKPLMTGVS